MLVTGKMDIDDNCALARSLTKGKFETELSTSVGLPGMSGDKGRRMSKQEIRLGHRCVRLFGPEAVRCILRRHQVRHLRETGWLRK